MRIAVDAMGGDHAPQEVVIGTVQAINSRDDIEAILVGDQDAIETELKKLSWPTDRISICHTSQVVEMNESPALALRKKKDSSIMAATLLVKKGLADAVVSCGNTGAQMSAAVFGWGRMEGIDRPAIGVLIPRNQGDTVLLDTGANVDAKPGQLIQFALMGKSYAEIIVGNNNPRVGLLGNGEEDTKGNQVSLAAFAQLKEIKSLNFVGNVEGRDLFSGIVDVVVCDGFFGNTIIKVLEGLALTITERLASNGIDVGHLLQDFDYSQVGGAPLLGVDGVSVVCHGSSKRDAVYNGIIKAEKCVSAGLVARLKNSLSLYNS
ncbi:MAG: phosphate acyltransferase PlsX [Syntrophomonadaceae bacterium]|nr:phosphate acyltransferase PlsX [Syntrophomonadaceae bacterium]